MQARRRRLESWVERRWPALYDARHAARGLARLLGPLVGPLIGALLFALVVAPVLALIAGLHLLGLDLPDVHLPTIDLPAIHPPAWLRAVGRVLGDALDVVAGVAKVLVIAGAVVYGISRTRRARRDRAAAEALGRTELLRRLAVALAVVRDDATAGGRELLDPGRTDRPGPSV